MELWGNLKDFSLPDVIQLVGFGRKSGVLGVENEGATAKLFFVEGNVVHAEMGKLVGEDAVYMLFRLGEGEFRFQAEKEPPNQTIFMDPTNLVMEAARLLDESSRSDMEEPGEEAREAAPSDGEESEVEAVSPPPMPPVESESIETEIALPEELEEPELPTLPDELPDLSTEVLGGGAIESQPEDLDSEFIVVEEEEHAEEEIVAPRAATPDEIRGELKALLEEKFGRDSKRLLQAVEKCGDTLEEFQQLVKRVERFVSAFVDSKSAAKIGEELREITAKLSP